MDTKTKIAIGLGLGGIAFLALKRQSTPAAVEPGNPLEVRFTTPQNELEPLPPVPQYQSGAVSPQVVTVYERQFQDVMRGDPVIWVMQHRLRDLGYDPGAIDGRWLPTSGPTFRAIQDFARNMGVPVPTRLPPSLALSELIERAHAERFGPPSLAGVSNGSSTPSTKGGYDPSSITAAKPLSGWEPQRAIAGEGRYARRY